MTRFSTVGGFVAAVVWLVASNGCEATLAQGRSAATAATVEERRTLPVAFASINKAVQAGRTNLRPAALDKDKKDHDGVEGGMNDAVTQRVMRREAVGGGGGRTRPIKSSEGFSIQSKRMTKERTVDWAKQLSVSQKDVDQLVKAYNDKEASLATRNRFLSKRHTDATDNDVKGQWKLVQPSNMALKMPASSSSEQSFLDAMRNKSSNRAASSTRSISPSHQRELRRKNGVPELNDFCSDSNPTFLVGGAMVIGSLEGAQNYTAESCASSLSGDVGLWCK
jgi:hypothetical protein